MGFESTRPGAIALIRRQSPLFLRYAVAGAVGTSCHYLTMFLLLGVLTPVIASTVGALVGLVVNYQIARMWVFRGRDSLSYPFAKFFIVALTGVGVNAAILSLAILYSPVWTGQIVATGCALLSGYVLNDLWSFRARKA